MADGTRFKNLSDKLDDMLGQMTIFSSQMTDMQHRLSNLESKPPSSPHSINAINNPPSPRHFLKLDVPRFDGSDPLGWIFKITQFFDYHNTPEEERITVASFYLDGAALAWFQWMYRNGQIHSWQHLLQALETRFAPTAFDDPRGRLFKLTQTTTVSAFLTEFEAVANRVTGLSPQFLLSCFIFGLKPEIRREVIAQQPPSLTHAVGLARLHEEKLQDLSRIQRAKPGAPWSSPPFSRTFTPFAPPQTIAPKPLPPLLPSPPPKTRFRQLTEAEMADRREKGLCFNCDQKYSRSHRCPARFLLLIAEDDDPPSAPDLDFPAADPDPSLVDPSTVTSVHPAQISLHALSGTGAPKTLRLTGQIAHHPIRVLVDGGSTHNFIQKNVALQLGLGQSPTSPLKVLVGSGEELACDTVCLAVALSIQGHSFQLDLYVLDMGGSDVVLGAQWLKQLGPILMDYQALTMKFVYNQVIVELKGDSGQSSSLLSLHQFKRVVNTIQPKLNPITNGLG
uniref:Retrotransposon-derived protein PEG10 n=1 Tax=Cajanus cajan TaxID=3821 RepID=A0A151TPI3_CAJCA|nr:Retrotransposon-derived protein PEG10 [Cajanus cajan]